METTKPRSKLSRTFKKVINLRTASNNGICLLASQYKVKDGSIRDPKSQNRAMMDAVVAKLFANVSSIKAAYAEMQMAQNPYNSQAIQVADQAVVNELKAVSELKRSFLKNQVHLSPQVTLMLAEIQEQQSLMRTYEITIKKMEIEKERKDSEISSLKKKFQESVSMNRDFEKKLNSSGSLSVLENLSLSKLNPTHFVQFLHSAVRSIKSFVKLLIREMESANWDLDSAVQFIEPGIVFPNPNHRIFAFESFVSKTMFDDFTNIEFSSPDEKSSFSHDHQSSRKLWFEKFKKLKSVNPKKFLAQNPSSSLGKFSRTKYLQLVHAKMECSFFGNLNQRKVINNGGFPDSAFFAAFAEMAKRVWVLNCLGLSFEEKVSIFQVKRGCRFSEVYMELATDEALLLSGDDMPVVFTVVPGFCIGKTVIQSQVYLSSVTAPAR